MPEPLKILIADDNDSDRLILTAIIKREGHVAFTACDGIEAVDAYKESQPDIVLMDALMPNMDGFEAARQIKSLAGDDLVPIIFLTSLQDATSLAECLDSGGDDFLSKPYNRLILKAKINAFSRMRKMHSAIQEHNRQLLLEQQVAKAVFDNVAHAGCLKADNIKYSLSPLAVFNGDTVLAERRPGGGMHLFLGDFTGHGLPAAIGAMPVAEIFYGMTAKGFDAGVILREMNKKLGRILPTGVFCCGCFADMSFLERSVKVWQGGLPDSFLYRVNSGEVEHIQSNSLPLGVVKGSSFNPQFIELNLDVGDRLFMWSDGIHESRNEQDEMFGEDRLKDVFYQTEKPEKLFGSILAAADKFIGEGERDDDVTVLEVTMVDHDKIASINLDENQESMAGPPAWQMEYQLLPETLRVYNPLPLILHIITEVEGMRSVSGELYTLLAELYSNALEHGILGLDSNLKKSAEGFATYYSEREARLQSLKDAVVKISLRHEPKGKGGRLFLQFEDSGAGFDHERVLERQRTNKEYSGRGIPLLRKICDSFEYQGNGNTVNAVITWPKEKSQ